MAAINTARKGVQVETDGLASWHEFFVAAAALAGLVVVAVSVNVDRIIKRTV